MTDKTRNKRNHILEAVPMSREHKNMLVEVFDEMSAGAGGGSNEKVAIDIDLTNNKVCFQGVEYTCEMTQESTELNSMFILNFANAELNKVLLDYSKGNNWIDFINIANSEDIMQSAVLCHWLDMNKRNPAFVISQGPIFAIKFTI